MIDKKKSNDFIKISRDEYNKYLDDLKKRKKKEKTTIQIRISKEKKKDWEEFVEKNSNFKNISQLIRTSVNDYIFPDLSKHSFEKEQIPLDFNECLTSSLSRIDNWQNYNKIRTLEEIVRQFNTIAKKEYRKEIIQEKLLDIQQYLLAIILEISSLIQDE